MRIFRWLLALVFFVAKISLVSYTLLRAYRLRRHSVDTYGYVIHEFDPWFNFRATEYLAEHGSEKFFKWYDHMSWYPIGRPVGTTIYPGMQFVAVYIWEGLKHVPEYKWKTPKEWLKATPTWLQAYFPNKAKGLSVGPMSLNDVCCMVPAWFGSVATWFTFMFTYEVSESVSAGVIAAGIMAIIPAHMMRSSSGEFDNECVAMTAFVLVLWLWCRSIRTAGSWPWAILAALAYGFAAATWGGYIFINNLIGLHALLIVGTGQFDGGRYKAYTIVWLFGSFLASRVPVIGMAPYRSIEQMPSLLVFGGYQLMAFGDLVRKRYPMGPWKYCFFRVGIFVMAGVAAAAAAYVLASMGVFMPLGARIRGLFLEAVKTGNPLVDSVAEHQPASPQAYKMYLGSPRNLAVVGIAFIWHQKTPGKYMAFLYAAVAYWYSLKMSRLLLVCAPIVSLLAGVPCGIVLDWCEEQVLNIFAARKEDESKPELRTGGMGSIWRTLWRWFGFWVVPKEARDIVQAKDDFAREVWPLDRLVRVGIAGAILYFAYTTPAVQREIKDFITHSDQIGKQFASPQLMFMHRDRSGQEVIIDDYYRGYLWIDANTPKDSRVMAWWDYGYQITGVARRTSIADGNTWNHEHIATLGRVLTSPVKRAHKAIRHLADYILVWAGGHGDDMGKSPHLARIGNSVFPDHCGDDDPLCHKFSFSRDGSPTPMMAESLLYQAVNHRVKPEVELSSKFFKEVHTTKHGLMRVFQVMNISEESKEWIADPTNRICDAPGSWYCVGQYPPALMPLIAKRRNFAQLEDFNKKGAAKSAYTKLIEDQRDGKKSEL